MTRPEPPHAPNLSSDPRLQPEGTYKTGEVLAKHMNTAGVSVAELSNLLEVPYKMTFRWRKGIVPLTESRIAQIETVLNLKPGEFWQ